MREWWFGGAPVAEPRSQPQARRRLILPASCRGLARGAHTVLGAPARRASEMGGGGGSAAPGFDGPVPGLPSRGLGAGELGGALVGCGEPAAPWHRGGAGDAVSVQRV